MLLLAFIITLTHPSQFSLCSVRQMYIQWWSNEDDEELPWSNLTMLTVIVVVLRLRVSYAVVQWYEQMDLLGYLLESGIRLR